ncbi:hypothetical protein V8C42DRAFT_310142 [Trichoderma barbatum]
MFHSACSFPFLPFIALPCLALPRFAHCHAVQPPSAALVQPCLCRPPRRCIFSLPVCWRLLMALGFGNCSQALGGSRPSECICVIATPYMYHTGRGGTKAPAY